MMKTNIKELYNKFKDSSGITTDSRKVILNSLFFALKGPSFDGNKFAAKALKEGAAYAIIDDVDYQQGEKYILVENVLSTLQTLANYHRNQFDIPVIAITGSNGKTTTKELLSAVMNTTYNCHFTKGNLNNHIGVPLTLLQLSSKHEVAIIEMGANHVGEIADLCQIAAPTHGIITNIGKAHLEGFGGLEGVKKGKSELYKYLMTNSGLVFINKDEPFLSGLAEKNVKKVFYCQSDNPELENDPYEVKLLNTKPFVEVSFLDKKGEMEKVNSQLIGRYNFNNIMTAVAIGKYFKVAVKRIKLAIEGYLPQNNRSQIVEINKNRIILDAYNANPISMKMALENLGESTRRRGAIIGDMLELGDFSKEEHEKILLQARGLNLDFLFLVGNEFAGFPLLESEKHYFKVNDLKEVFGFSQVENMSILVKGSRSIGLEKILETA